MCIQSRQYPAGGTENVKHTSKLCPQKGLIIARSNLTPILWHHIDLSFYFIGPKQEHPTQITKNYHIISTFATIHCLIVDWGQTLFYQTDIFDQWDPNLCWWFKETQWQSTHWLVRILAIDYGWAGTLMNNNGLKLLEPLVIWGTCPHSKPRT